MARSNFHQLWGAAPSALGIQVISINEPVEDTPSGRLLEGIIEVIDEFYSANLSQDVLRGMRENAGRGFCNGGRGS